MIPASIVWTRWLLIPIALAVGFIMLMVRAASAVGLAPRRLSRPLPAAGVSSSGQRGFDVRGFAP